jgi:hypothetical protein
MEPPSSGSRRCVAGLIVLKEEELSHSLDPNSEQRPHLRLPEWLFVRKLLSYFDDPKEILSGSVKRYERFTFRSSGALGLSGNI